MRLTLDKKKELVQELEKNIESYPVIGLLDMTSVPAKQLQQMKKDMRGSVLIKVTRKKLLTRALEKAKKSGVKDLLNTQSSQPALVFSKDNSFALFKTLKKNKSPAPAKAGVVCPRDVVIEAGPTDFPPGPMISEFSKLGLKTKVEGKVIAISETKTIVKAGETLKAEVAEVLNKLGFEPLEIGLNLKATFEDGVIFEQNVLDVDTDEYVKRLKDAARSAFNLSVNAGHPTKQNVEILIGEAVRNAKDLVIEVALPQKEYIDEVLARTDQKAKALDRELGDWNSTSPAQKVEEVKKEVPKTKDEN